ncbi:MAG TPA: phosphohistidine phosphatase SixA [Kofleriaceae bacterium]|nr:phosphohistidine phosphatase SixA [Kofleriaceae bacterium]
MQLFVIRHGIAEDAEPGQDDASRQLTTQGEKRVKRIVRGLRALDISFNRVLTSPWARALRTAELLAPICDVEPIASDLLTQTPRAELLAQIAELGEDTAVVGHEPWLGELVAWLAFGDQRHGEALDLKKASVTWLEGTAVPGGMTIRAMMPPRLLRRLA